MNEDLYLICMVNRKTGMIFWETGSNVQRAFPSKEDCKTKKVLEQQLDVIHMSRYVMKHYIPNLVTWEEALVIDQMENL